MKVKSLEPAARRMMMLVVVHVIALFISGQEFMGASAQTAINQRFTRIDGPSSKDIPTPGAGANNGTKDAGAVEIINKYLDATNSRACPNYAAKGYLAPANSDSTRNLDLRFLSQGAEGIQVEVKLENGARTSSFHGQEATSQTKGANDKALPDDLAYAETIALQRCFQAVLTDATVTLEVHRGDPGRDAKFARVTLTKGASPESGNSGSTPQAVDLYFDVTTNLLERTVAVASVSTRDASRDLLITTYSNYLAVDGVLIPTTLRQSINGQDRWEMHLQDIHLSTKTDTPEQL